MKKILALVLASVMVLGLFAGCGGDTDETTAPVTTAPAGETEAPATEGETEETEATEAANVAFDYDAIEDNMTAADGKYAIAFVTDVGQLKDKSFNQGTWEGVKRYASEHDKSYKYYQPANDSAATDDDRYDAMKAAVDGGAEIVVCAGFLQETALKRAAEEFPETKFVFIDGYPVNDSTGAVLMNVLPISFQEEQSGYLAGYAAVKEGFTKLGFTGGGGGANPACNRFGYGYVQGANAAAEELGINVEMKFSWEYGSSFSASPELQTMLNGWYSAGTEVIFACGGQMCQSAFSAASANDAFVIGVDVDQASESDTVITSAMKGLREAVIYACTEFYEGRWDAIGGNGIVLGAANDAIGLPTASWSLENFSVEDYNALLAQMKDGTVVVDNNYDEGLKAENFANVTLNID